MSDRATVLSARCGTKTKGSRAAVAPAAAVEPRVCIQVSAAETRARLVDCCSRYSPSHQYLLDANNLLWHHCRQYDQIAWLVIVQDGSDRLVNGKVNTTAQSSYFRRCNCHNRGTHVCFTRHLSTY